MSCRIDAQCAEQRARRLHALDARTGKPIEWIRIHKLGDYSYFNHAAHVNSGEGYAVYIDGRLLAESETGVAVRQGGQPRGRRRATALRWCAALRGCGG